MTFLFLSVRYIGIGHVVYVWNIMYTAFDWTGDVLNVILGGELYASRSRKVLIFLVVIFMMQVSGEEAVLSGTYQCMIGYPGGVLLLVSITWILGIVWEVLALCFAVWIAVKHFRELQQHSTRGIFGDCFTVLMQTHVSYFASFLAVSCFEIGLFSPMLSANPFSLETQTYLSVTLKFHFVQLFVLGPRLILSVREYHAKLVADSHTASVMTSIAFQERVHVETSSTV
ncbi:hypothetical protein BDR05DRAFT_971325 [Suillus weaverae]|nr:hypothetical protein BDR05DRAFT_971325 [Suillus weaverae]